MWACAPKRGKGSEGRRNKVRSAVRRLGRALVRCREVQQRATPGHATPATPRRPRHATPRQTDARLSDRARPTHVAALPVTYITLSVPETCARLPAQAAEEDEEGEGEERKTDSESGKGRTGRCQGWRRRRRRRFPFSLGRTGWPNGDMGKSQQQHAMRGHRTHTHTQRDREREPPGRAADMVGRHSGPGPFPLAMEQGRRRDRKEGSRR